MFVDPSCSLGGRGQEFGGTSVGPKEAIACLALEVLADRCPIGVLGGSHSPSDLHVGKGATQGLAISWKTLSNNNKIIITIIRIINSSYLLRLLAFFPRSRLSALHSLSH